MRGLRVGTSSSFTSGSIAYYRTITIDHTKVSGGSNLTNYPVYFGGTYTYLKTRANGGKVNNSNGYDIIFSTTTSPANKLDFEIEYWNASTGEIHAFFRQPTLTAASDDVLYLLYGDDDIVADQQNITGVWNSNYKSVWHLKESPTASAPEYQESTSANNDGTARSSMDAGDNVTGKIHKGMQVDDADNNHGMDASDSGYPATNTARSMTAWVYLNNYVNYASFANYGALTNSQSFKWGTDTGATGNKRQFIGIYAVNASAYSTTDIGLGAWAHIGFTFSAGTITYYYNGAADGTATVSPNTTLNGAMAVGATQSGWGDSSMDGTIDEFRVTNNALTAGWIGTDYNNQSSPSTFYTLGSETAV